jgi:hypothetical protein
MCKHGPEGGGKVSSGYPKRCDDFPHDYECPYCEIESAVEALRDIASFKTMSKRQRLNSERAITWLFAHGYPLEPGGYVPGIGFTEET